MGKKLKRKKAAFDAKAVEQRLDHYGKSPSKDKFGKPSHTLVKAKALQEVSTMLLGQPETSKALKKRRAKALQEVAILIVQPETLQALKSRKGGQRKWLHQDHVEVFREQKHLDGGSVERAYWHYGYMVALGDVIRLLERENPTKH